MVRFKKVILILIILIGIWLRFYKLDWGDGLFTHPDERNIAGGIMNLSYPSQMNPKFFAYGGFPLYLYYFTGYVLNNFLPKLNLLSFDNIILIGRFWSAFFSSLTLIFFYLLSRKFLSQNSAIFSVLLLAFIPGVIQQAHFATVETLLSFFLVLIIYLCIKYLERRKRKYILLASVMGGLAVGTKMSALLFLPPIFLIILIIDFFQPLAKFFSSRHSSRIQNLIPSNDSSDLPSETTINNLSHSRHSGGVQNPFPSCHSRERGNLYNFFKLFLNFIFLVTCALSLVTLFFVLTNPYVILDYGSFRGSMNYETGVGFGNPIVFYTRQFEKTTPILFQFTKIFPYALGPSITFFAILGILLFSYKAIVQKKIIFIFYLLSFIFYLVPNLLIFAKWTRFVAPIFPFFVFFAVYFISLSSRFNRDLFKYIIISLLFFPTLLWSLAFFSIYTRRDVRFVASDWIIANLKPKSQILFETGNVIDVPLGGDFTHTSYDFFHIDQDNKREEFFREIEKADYFLIQSRRVWANYPRLPETHPTTAKFYDLLWSGKLGFEKIAEFDSFPKIFGFKINDELAEETFTVFDHPHISIWKNVNRFSKDNYRILFK